MQIKRGKSLKILLINQICPIKCLYSIIPEDTKITAITMAANINTPIIIPNIGANIIDASTLFGIPNIVK